MADSWPKWVAITSLLFDGIIAACAFAGGCFVAEQLKLMRESNAIALDAVIADKRQAEEELHKTRRGA